MKRPPWHRLDQRDPTQLRRSAAIILGLQGQLILTLLVAVCAAELKSPGQFQNVVLLIAGYFLLQMLTALTIHLKSRTWPSCLVLLTSSAMIAIGSTLAQRDRNAFEHQNWLIAFYWLCTGATAVFSLIEVLKRDLRPSVSD